MNTLSFSQSLFFSLQQQDFSAALAALENGANPSAIFELSKGTNISSFQLCIQKCSEYGFKKGPLNSKYREAFEVIKSIVKKTTIQCKCIKEHKCPLFIALQTFKITKQQQILEGKCELIRYLIVNGADIKYEPKQDQRAKKNPGKWNLHWFDIDGIRSYLITKQFTYVQTKA